MAQFLTEAWERMSERARSQFIHSLISIVGVLATAGGIYWANTLSVERFMARIEAKMVSQNARIEKLEETVKESSGDRLTIERRLTGMEVGQSTILNALKDMREEIRSVRTGQRP